MTTVQSATEGLSRLDLPSGREPLPAHLEAQLFASICESTEQKPEEIDQVKVVVDHKKDAVFTCPILLTEYTKVEDGVCIGLWNKKFCNHWVNKEALVQHLCARAQQGVFDHARLSVLAQDALVVTFVEQPYTDAAAALCPHSKCESFLFKIS